MKTLQEWLDLLPEDIKDKALIAIQEQHNKTPIATEMDIASHVLSYPSQSIGVALANAFIWDETKERDEFWTNVARDYEHQFQLKNIIDAE